MAWVRRVRTASGATAVQIAEYVQGRRRIVAHVGSAHTDAELGVLLEQARLLLADERQAELDLGVEQTPGRSSLLAAPVAEQPLFGAGSRPGAPVRVPAARVVATPSRLLFDTLAGVYDELGFGVVGDEVFRDLVIARVVEPTSVLDTGRVLADLGRVPASEKTMRRTLARCVGRGYRDQVATACFAHALAAGGLSLVLYDVTTLYFESDTEDALRKVGYSKERRIDPQIVVGLLVDRAGFPLEIGCYEGTQAETATIIPIIEQFAARHGVADMVVVADAGMLSVSNLAELDAAHLRFIVGSRVTKAPIDLASHFRWHGDAFTDGQVIDTLTPKTARVIENDPHRKAEPVWDKATHPGSWRAVWAYSAKRAARDGKTLTAQENRAKAVMAGEKTARTPRFVTITNGTKTLDERSLARARRLGGLKGYVTNIPATLMPADEVIASYHDLWQVEQSFRMSKTDLRARPMFVRTRDAIEAHLTIVFAALAVSREVQQRTGLTIRNAVRQLRPLRAATIAVNGAEQTLPPEIPEAQRALLDAITAGPLRH